MPSDCSHYASVRSDFTQLFTGLPRQNLISFVLSARSAGRSGILQSLPWLAYMRTHELHAKGLPIRKAKMNIRSPTCLVFLSIYFSI